MAGVEMSLWSSNWPDDLVYIVNGRAITKTDILRAKKDRQLRQLAAKRRHSHISYKPCFVWVFHNSSWLYRGWWLYVRTLKTRWGINFEDRYHKLIPEIMRRFPCGHLPIKENFDLWAAAFVAAYPRQNLLNQGAVQAWAKIAPNGDLLDVMSQSVSHGQRGIEGSTRTRAASMTPLSKYQNKRPITVKGVKK